MDYLHFKALHIIFVVTWFSGLFYIVRLFIYQSEAYEKSPEEQAILIPQYKLMSKRLWYGITWPSAILTLIFGLTMLSKNTALLTQGWMLIKFGFLVLLYLYHFGCQYIFKLLQKDHNKFSSMKLRVWNEVATLFLISIVFIVILKSTLSWIWGVFGLIVVTIIIMIAIRIYKRIRHV